MKSFKVLKLLSTVGLLSTAGLLAAQAQAYNCAGVANYQQGTYATGAIVQNAGSAYSVLWVAGVRLEVPTNQV